MKKLLAITILGMLFCNTSFAISPEMEKIVYDGCYPGVKSKLGSKNAEVYCGCFVAMTSQKWSDQEFDIITSQSEEKQIKSMKFAVDYCNTFIK